jgi:hypothetical protein
VLDDAARGRIAHGRVREQFAEGVAAAARMMLLDAATVRRRTDAARRACHTPPGAPRPLRRRGAQDGATGVYRIKDWDDAEGLLERAFGTADEAYAYLCGALDTSDHTDDRQVRLWSLWRCEGGRREQELAAGAFARRCQHWGEPPPG